MISGFLGFEQFSEEAVVFIDSNCCGILPLLETTDRLVSALGRVADSAKTLCDGLFVAGAQFGRDLLAVEHRLNGVHHNLAEFVLGASRGVVVGHDVFEQHVADVIGVESRGDDGLCRQVDVFDHLADVFTVILAQMGFANFGA